MNTELTWIVRHGFLEVSGDFQKNLAACQTTEKADLLRQKSRGGVKWRRFNETKLRGKHSGRGVVPWSDLLQIELGMLSAVVER